MNFRFSPSDEKAYPFPGNEKSLTLILLLQSSIFYNGSSLRCSEHIDDVAVMFLTAMYQNEPVLNIIMKLA